MITEKEVNDLRKESEQSFTAKRFEIANGVLDMLLHDFDLKIDNALKCLKNQEILRDDEDIEIFLTLLNENFQARNEIRILKKM